jgi:quinoprotein glucose dehydrogenase
MMRYGLPGAAAALAVAAALFGTPAAPPTARAAAPNVVSEGTSKGQWPTYTGDLRGTRYSPLDQINAANFNELEVAWRFKTDSLGPRPEFKLEGTPLMVGRVLYATAGTRRSVVALDAATGELLWVHSEREGARGANAPRQLSGRGLAYWSDGREERILYVTPGYRLIALDAKSGQRIAGFGEDGAVDLKRDIDQEIDPVTGEIGLQSAPASSSEPLSARA